MLHWREKLLMNKYRYVWCGQANKMSSIWTRKLTSHSVFTEVVTADGGWLFNYLNEAAWSNCRGYSSLQLGICLTTASAGPPSPIISTYLFLISHCSTFAMQDFLPCEQFSCLPDCQSVCYTDWLWMENPQNKLADPRIIPFPRRLRANVQLNAYGFESQRGDLWRENNLWTALIEDFNFVVKLNWRTNIKSWLPVKNVIHSHHLNSCL